MGIMTKNLQNLELYLHPGEYIFLIDIINKEIIENIRLSFQPQMIIYLEKSWCHLDLFYT